MIQIGLIDVDGHNFPNLALMKIARYWKEQGADVRWYDPFSHFDKVYMSKVFTFTADYQYCISNADDIEKGGTGYMLYDKKLPEYIDQMQPDYSIYKHLIDDNTAIGFLTRGCIRNCKWCIVPKKEGKISAYMDIDDVAIEGRKNIILMDNNVLASAHGLEQIAKIAERQFKIDFNQAMDCRLVTSDIAELLARVRWNRYARFSCDTSAELQPIFKACELLKQKGYNKEVFVYVLLTEDIHECLDRINRLRSFKTLRLIPFAQPYIDFSGKRQTPQWQKDMATWCNKKSTLFGCEFRDFQVRKGFRCQRWLEDNYC